MHKESLSVDLSTELHAFVVRQADERNISIDDVVEEIIRQQLKHVELNELFFKALSNLKELKKGDLLSIDDILRSITSDGTTRRNLKRRLISFAVGKQLITEVQHTGLFTRN